MADLITLKLTSDELEMLLDALENDMESYAEVIREARGNNARDDVETFTEAAERIAALMGKLRPLVDSE